MSKRLLRAFWKSMVSDLFIREMGLRGTNKLLWVFIGSFLFGVLLFFPGFSLSAETIGVYLNSSNSSYSLDSNLPVLDNTGGPVYGIFVDNDTTDAFSLTINAGLNATATNATGGSKA
ncbi:MAG: hypothetical protein ACP5K0_07430, partial [Thermosulfidibacteraceae bacterium]